MTTRRINVLALAAAGLLLALSLVPLFLPVYHFEANVYTKRSGNTFVGDERYKAAREEIDALVRDYESRGIETDVTEEIIERVNSKGQTTSLIVFRVNKEISCSGWDFVRTGFPTGRLLVLMPALGAAAVALAALGCIGSLDAPWRRLPLRARLPRNAAVFLALAALAVSVVFVLATNVVINRRISLYAAGVAPSPGDAVLAAADRLIYQGAGGAETAALLKNTTSSLNLTWWLELPILFGLVCALTVVARGRLAAPLRKGLLYFCVIAMCAFILYPFIIMFTSAFRTDAEATDIYFQHIFPETWLWSNLDHILGRGVLRYLLNSVLLSAGATCLALLCGIPAAYALARMRFKGRKLYLGFVIMSQMFAPVVLLVGISRLMINLNLNDTLTGLVFINAAFNQAFAIWLLRGTFVSISPEVEQAACIDGCNSVSALVRILLPMAAPDVVTTLIFVFINSWNEYTISTVIINSDLNRPITVGLTQFAAFSMIQWNYLFASSLLATIPVVILFMLIEKHLTSGLTAGGVKG